MSSQVGNNGQQTKAIVTSSTTSNSITSTLTTSKSSIVDVNSLLVDGTAQFQPKSESILLSSSLENASNTVTTVSPVTTTTATLSINLNNQIQGTQKIFVSTDGGSGGQQKLVPVRLDLLKVQQQTSSRTTLGKQIHLQPQQISSTSGGQIVSISNNPTVSIVSISAAVSGTSTPLSSCSSANSLVQTSSSNDQHQVITKAIFAAFKSNQKGDSQQQSTNMTISDQVRQRFQISTDDEAGKQMVLTTIPVSAPQLQTNSAMLMKIKQQLHDSNALDSTQNNQPILKQLTASSLPGSHRLIVRQHHHHHASTAHTQTPKILKQMTATNHQQKVALVATSTTTSPNISAGNFRLTPIHFDHHQQPSQHVQLNSSAGLGKKRTISKINSLAQQSTTQSIHLNNNETTFVAVIPGVQVSASNAITSELSSTNTLSSLSSPTVSTAAGISKRRRTISNSNQQSQLVGNGSTIVATAPTSSVTLINRKAATSRLSQTNLANQNNTHQQQQPSLVLEQNCLIESSTSVDGTTSTGPRTPSNFTQMQLIQIPASSNNNKNHHIQHQTATTSFTQPTSTSTSPNNNKNSILINHLMRKSQLSDVQLASNSSQQQYQFIQLMNGSGGQGQSPGTSVFNQTSNNNKTTTTTPPQTITPQQLQQFLAQNNFKLAAPSIATVVSSAKQNSSTNQTSFATIQLQNINLKSQGQQGAATMVNANASEVTRLAQILQNQQAVAVQVSNVPTSSMQTHLIKQEIRLPINKSCAMIQPPPSSSSVSTQISRSTSLVNTTTNSLQMAKMQSNEYTELQKNRLEDIRTLDQAVLFDSSSSSSSTTAVSSSSVLQINGSVVTGGNRTVAAASSNNYVIINGNGNNNNDAHRNGDNNNYNNHNRRSLPPNIPPSLAPVWCKVFDKYGHNRCAPVWAFAHVPLISEWPSLVPSDDDQVIPPIIIEVFVNENDQSTKAKLNPGSDSIGNESLSNNSNKNINHQSSSSQKLNNNVQTERSIWFATIVAHSGYYLCLRWVGLRDLNRFDFWINFRKRNLFPVGWAKQEGFQYSPPREVLENCNPQSVYLSDVQRLLSPGSRTIETDLHSLFVKQLQTELKPGTRVEVIDKTRFSCFRVAVVNEVVGKRVNVRYDGEPPEDLGLWIHVQSEYIRPVGWSYLVGHELYASKNYALKSLELGVKNLRHHIKLNRDRIDWNQLGMLKKYEFIEDGSLFREGMKLEAVDPYNLSMICAVTVKKVLRFNFLVLSIDSVNSDSVFPLFSPQQHQQNQTQFASSGSDLFCVHSSSPYILPSGFCQTFGIGLVSPSVHKNWVHYSMATNSVVAPSSFFSFQAVKHKFCEGMLLEAVDLVEPNLICVAVIKKCAGRLLLLHFIGWGDAYDQWCDCCSPNIFPVGYCDLVGVPLQGPPSTNKANDKKKRLPMTPSFKKKTKKGPNLPKIKNLVDSISTSSQPANSAMISSLEFDGHHLINDDFDLIEQSKLNDFSREDFDKDEETGRTEETEESSVQKESDQNEFVQDDEYEQTEIKDFKTQCQERESTELYNFLSNQDNQLANDGLFLEFNSLTVLLSSKIELGDGRRIVFNDPNLKRNQFCLSFESKQIESFNIQWLYPRKVDSEFEEAIEEQHQTRTSISNVYNFFRQDENETEEHDGTSNLAMVPYWSHRQVAKFMARHGFEDCCDQIISYKIDGKRLMSLSKMQAIRLAVLPSTAQRLVVLVEALRSKYKKLTGHHPLQHPMSSPKGQIR